MLHPVKVGDVIEDDKGNSYFYTGDGYIEIVTKEHHQKLIEKYLKKQLTNNRKCGTIDNEETILNKLGDGKFEN